MNELLQLLPPEFSWRDVADILIVAAGRARDPHQSITKHFTFQSLDRKGAASRRVLT